MIARMAIRLSLSGLTKILRRLLVFTIKADDVIVVQTLKMVGSGAGGEYFDDKTPVSTNK